ncbi:MAG: alpha/beta fold hydrolase [Alphaproteobacteria bacterium]|nr:alpha/beta fold hydrolase [Alphaproteobacteria bacterium]
MDTAAIMIEDRFVTWDGLRLRYIEAGAGHPVLLLHGASLGSSADVFLGTIGGFAGAGLRAIAFDQPGFGLSDNPTDFSVARRRDSILGLMDALGIERAALVAHSQAGNMAFALAEKHPGRISHVVALGTGSLLPPLPGAAPKKATGPAEGRDGTAAEPMIEDTRKLLEATLFHTELITEEALVLRHTRSTGKNFEAFVARGALPAFGKGKAGGAPVWDRLAESPVPVRLIYGREDRADAAERAALLKRMHPGIDLHLIDGCKHLVPWDAAEAYVRLSVAFIRG